MELNRPRRTGRRGSAGLSLIELLVAITVLALIGGALGGAFAIGIRALGPGGSQEQLAGSHDLLAFEQQIGADVARADCLAAPGQVSIPTGGCKSSVQNGASTCGATYVLCLAWYLPGSSTCHTVIYSLKPDRTVLRTDISASGGAPSGRSVQVTTNPVLVTAAWTPVTTTTATYKWTNLVNVTVTQRGAPGAPVLNPATATFKLVPLSVDPLSPVLPGGSQTC